MLRENTVFAQKIINYYAEKGIGCSIVDEHLSLLVTISAEGEIHEFRYGNRAFAGMHNSRKFYLVLERELAELKSLVSAAEPAADRTYRSGYRGHASSRHAAAF